MPRKRGTERRTDRYNLVAGGHDVTCSHREKSEPFGEVVDAIRAESGPGVSVLAIDDDDGGFGVAEFIDKIGTQGSVVFVVDLDEVVPDPEIVETATGEPAPLT